MKMLYYKLIVFKEEKIIEYCFIMAKDYPQASDIAYEYVFKRYKRANYKILQARDEEIENEEKTVILCSI